MKKLRLIIFLVVALAQISVPASMIWKRQCTLSEGRAWKFRTAPVDPVDVLRGRYLVLRFAAETTRATAPPSNDGGLYAVLTEDAEGFAVVDHVTPEPRRGDNIIRVEYAGIFEGEVRLRFPFDRYWINEVEAPAAERAYFAHGRENGYAIVRVARGDAAIEELYLAGMSLRDYLRANP